MSRANSKKLRQVLAWAPLIIALLIVSALAVASLKPASLDSPMIGQAAPSIIKPPELSVANENQADGNRMLNFWASWCAPCEIEHPLLMELAAKGVPIDGVAYHDEKEKAMEVLRRDGNPYQNLWLDPRGEIALRYGLSGVPETFIISSEGRILHHVFGPLDPGTYRRGAIQKYFPQLQSASED